MYTNIEPYVCHPSVSPVSLIVTSSSFSLTHLYLNTCHPQNPLSLVYEKHSLKPSLPIVALDNSFSVSCVLMSLYPFNSS